MKSFSEQVGAVRVRAKGNEIALILSKAQARALVEGRGLGDGAQQNAEHAITETLRKFLEKVS